MQAEGGMQLGLIGPPWRRDYLKALALVVEFPPEQLEQNMTLESLESKVHHCKYGN